MTSRGEGKLTPDDPVEELAGYVNVIVRSLLVAGRSGAPAEGRIPFNPLYFNMLRILARDGGAWPSQMADLLGVPRTTVSTAVKALVKRGLVETSADERDRRALKVSLTEEGRQVLDAILRQDRRNAEAMLAALDPDEHASFLRAIAKVARGVSGEGQD